MDRSYKRRLFFFLWISCLAGGMTVIPYLLTNPLMAPLLRSLPLPALVVSVLAQSAVFFAIFTFLGIWLGEKVGLGVPFLQARLQGHPLPGFVRTAWRSLGAGLAAGALLFAMDRYVFAIFIEPITQAQDQASWWARLLVCFYGGINEEICFRFALMTLLVWLSWKIKATPDRRPTIAGFWIAIVASSVFFGLMHLPMTGDMVVITPLTVVRAVVLNSFIGIPCGWLFWKKGLEAAILFHFACDVALHVLLPLLI